MKCLPQDMADIFFFCATRYGGYFFFLWTYLVAYILVFVFCGHVLRRPILFTFFLLTYLVADIHNNFFLRSTVYDAGPTLDQHWVDVSCLLGPTLWRTFLYLADTTGPNRPNVPRSKHRC